MGKKQVMMCLTALVCSALAPRGAAAQIALGPVDLVLGTPKAAAIQALRRVYRVDSIVGAAPKDVWTVTSVDGSSSFTLVGTLTFAAGRLSSVSREWAPAEGEASQADAGRAVIGALLALAPATRRCDVGDRSYSGPGTDVRAVAVTCGARTIIVALSRYQGHDTFQVSEVLEANP